MRSIVIKQKVGTDPNFLVIGAQKCATTWLSRNIGQHPDSFVPTVDEIHFFNRRANYQKGIEWYQSQFVGYSGQKAVGEFTPNYLWTSENDREITENNHNYDIPKLVKKHYPDIKLIVSLRNPVKRAISSYYHQIRKKRVHPSSSILDVAHQHGIISMGFYDIHLKKWFEYFDRDSFLILILEEDIIQNCAITLKKLYEFIGVDSNFIPINAGKKVHDRRNDFYTHASYYLPESMAKALDTILPRKLREADLWKITIPESEIEELKQIYARHNEELSSLIQREIKW